MISEAICNAFCSNVAFTEVPIGYAVRTPFVRSDGDYVSFYIRQHEDEPSLYRVEDDGSTVAFLQSSGLDLDKETRFDAFTSMISEYKCRYDDREVLIFSEYMKEADLALCAVQFTALMARINDLTLLISSRVQKSFKEDLALLVQEQFEGSYEIEYDASINQELRDYLIDFIVRSNDGRSLAIFAGNSELKALEALLFAQISREREIKNLRSMIVLENPRPSSIKDRTLSRVINSDLTLASLENEKVAVARKMSETFGEGSYVN